MSIPLDRLYHYIKSIAQDVRKGDVLIYRFSPHGSKKLEDLTLTNSCAIDDDASLPHVICYDQEPLNYEFYEIATPFPEFKLLKLPEGIRKIYQQINFNKFNLRNYPYNIYDHAILIHSERRSLDVEKYSKNNFIPVYYWSHAVIARDWFRYAEHVTQNKNIAKTFLIYNRAWSGTREYRLGFADQLIMTGLHNQVLMRVSPVDSSLDKHYNHHRFKHPHWRPYNVIENYFPLCKAESHYSADFDLEDYESTDIEVVLETLFDDSRLHLTEKILRPIALGQPFILAGTYGSLQYLQDYGFKTFADCWDESYDMIPDSIERMNKIIDIMSNIVAMPKDKQDSMLTRAQEIAIYNKQHFFSDNFQNQINKELQDNLTTGLACIENLNTGQCFLDRRKKILSNAEYRNYSHLNKKNNSKQRKVWALLLKQARKYKRRSLSN